MEKNQIKAFLFTVLLFGGIAYVFFGSPSLPDFSGLKNLFKKEEATTKKRRNVADSKAGQKIDKYKGVDIYYNGVAGNVFGRNVANDGYNLGLKYQCVEFAKRFYYEAYNHKMPDSYGHAKDFYDSGLASNSFNKKRGMIQFRNKSFEKPKVDDLCIIGPSPTNKFGHLFIITKVTSTSIEFVQQNPGPRNPSRGTYEMVNQDGTWNIKAPYLVGWLRMP